MKIMETERLYLRELGLEDADALAKVLSDPESMQFYPVAFTRKKVEQWIQWNIANYANNQYGLWAVILKDGDQFLGDCGITMQVIEDDTVPEIGFHILKECCNKGYATEAGVACKKYAFNVLNYPQIFSYTTLKNIRHKESLKK